MKRYKEYKDSGVKWIGEIPGHTRIVFLKRIANITLGKMLASQPKSENDSLESYLCAKDIHFTGIDYSDLKQMYFSEEEKRNLKINKGDLLVVEGGAGAGGAYVATESRCCYIQNSVLKVRPNNSCNSQFLWYNLFNLIKQGYVDYVCNKATIPHFTKEKLGSTPIVLFPLSEQQAIVSYLDSKVSKIDEYISAAEKKIAALEELKQSLIAEAVTRGINPNVPMKESGVKWIGRVPEHWKIVAIKRFSEIILGKMLDRSNESGQQYLCAKDVHFNDINLSNLKKMYFSPEEQNKFRIKKGDLLVVEGGACGTCAILKKEVNDIFIQNSIMIVRGDNNKCVNDFIAYSIQSLVQKGYTESVCHKATIMHFTKEKLGNTSIPLPPLPEQQAIVAYLDTKTAQIDRLCQSERSQIEKLKEYKQRLISDVVTGKVDVS